MWRAVTRRRTEASFGNRLATRGMCAWAFCWEEAIPEYLHTEALERWAVGSLSRSDEILELQERLARRIQELGIEVISPVEEVLRTSSQITYTCPHCGEEKTAEASLLLQWSGHCHSCSKIVGNQQKRREWWEKVKEWCEHRQCTLLSEFQDDDRGPLSSERFFFLDEASLLRSSLVFTVARPIRQPLKDRTMLAIEDSPQIIRARLDLHFPPNQRDSE
ncbi:hypothetical protein HNR46_004022 [Haloferula luteola]|uniref:Uncharacterized protein n=1 Tax=Haloferula luteola TaxID=595692 RepID=A0A840VIS6_9BACT|nr:hypothetical protein [Haloferula luteola]MBB5353760.1 hypothetical protein [Haloferula luteola]